MTAEELKEKIQITRSSTTFGNIAVHASIKFDFEVMMDGNATDVELGQAEEFAKDKILRLIYEDQRQEIYDALNELIQNCSPSFLSANKFFEAQERLMKAARYQPHSTDDKKI